MGTVLLSENMILLMWQIYNKGVLGYQIQNRCVNTTLFLYLSIDRHFMPVHVHMKNKKLTSKTRTIIIKIAIFRVIEIKTRTILNSMIIIVCF